MVVEINCVHFDYLRCRHYHSGMLCDCCFWNKERNQDASKQTPVSQFEVDPEICEECGERSILKDREWVCSSCGTVSERILDTKNYDTAPSEFFFNPFGETMVNIKTRHSIKFSREYHVQKKAYKQLELLLSQFEIPKSHYYFYKIICMEQFSYLWRVFYNIIQYIEVLMAVVFYKATGKFKKELIEMEGKKFKRALRMVETKDIEEASHPKLLLYTYADTLGVDKQAVESYYNSHEHCFSGEQPRLWITLCLIKASPERSVEIRRFFGVSAPKLSRFKTNLQGVD